MKGLRKLLENYFALLLNRLAQIITTFILAASITRILGAYELGQYMLAFSFDSNRNSLKKKSSNK